MALIDFEGFDQESANISGWLNPFSSISASGSGWQSYGRYGNSGNGRSLPSNMPTLWIQGHFYVTSLNTTFIQLDDLTTAQVTFKCDVNGRVTAYRGTGTLLGTSTNIVISVNTWHFIQMRATISATVGTMEIWVDGVQALALTGVNNRQSANAYVNKWQTGTRADNIVIYDETGNVPNSRTPETRVFSDLPTGAGATTEMTPLSGANYQNVDENPSDGDTSYNSAAAAPATDTFAFAASIPAATIVYGVAAEIVARKDDAGGNEVDAVVRSGGSNTLSGSVFPLTTSYQRFRRQWDLDPATGLQWTRAGANAAEVGVKRTT